MEKDTKEIPTFEEYKENPEKYWSELIESLEKIREYLENKE